MKKLYEKSELSFSLLWIVLYVALFSAADSVSRSLEVEKLATAPLCVLFVGVLWRWIGKNGLQEKYGLCAFSGDLQKYLYFLPLALLASTNLWRGIALRLSVPETALYVLSMLCVGFIEEVIFRGFLFRAIASQNVRQAVAVSSVTFGLGHIVNLLNGAELLPTLLQICYAAAAGFLFTIIFYRGGSLWPCILTHSAINALSAFASEASNAFQIATAAAMTVLSLGYAAFILRGEKRAEG